MAENINNTEQSSSGNEEGEFKDQVTKDRIAKHLHDIDDHISAEDIKNIRTDVHGGAPVIKEEEPVQQPLPDKSSEEDKLNKTDNDPGKITDPWEILS